MWLEIGLIRHGMTAGNAKGRYVGRTDEGLCEKGREELTKKREVIQEKLGEMHRRVWVSPMQRCRETASILFPKATYEIVNGLRECDFGVFEYHNHEELNGRADYQAWIDGGGRGGFPEGESLEDFCERVVKSFESTVDTIVTESFSSDFSEEHSEIFVVHGGTIMAIMGSYARPRRDYFDWNVKNGEGFVVKLDTEKWLKGERELILQAKLSE